MKLCVKNKITFLARLQHNEFAKQVAASVFEHNQSVFHLRK